MTWVFNGICAGMLFGIIAFCVFHFVFGWINALYHKIKDGDLCSSDDTVGNVAGIGAIIVVVFWIVVGIWLQCSDKWVDFYDDQGEVIETYQITDYDESWFRDGTTFYLKDGRKIVKQDCIYEIRFQEDEVK